MRTDHGASLPEQDSPSPTGTAAVAPAAPRGPLRTVWSAICAGLGAALGLAPHLAHHAGLLLGAAVVTGAAGNAILAGLGIVLSIPLLRRLYRRYGTWRAPALALGLFAAMFTLSAVVIGPALVGGSRPSSPVPAAPSAPVEPTPGPSEADHTDHHPGQTQG
jgi:hypothetical protein